MYFFGIALVFMLLEFFVGNLKSRRKLFSLMAVIVLSSSQLLAQTDRSEVRKGNRLFNRENYKEAEVEYRKGLIKDSLSIASKYNLGNTLYRMEDAEQARTNYMEIADSVSKSETPVINWDKGQVESPTSMASDLFHNLGNSYLAQKKYSEAVEAYKNALRRNPADMDTKSNLAYAQKMLEDQQQQGGGGGQDNQNNQDNQDNKDNQNNQNNQDNKNDLDNQDDSNNQDGQDDRDNRNQNNGNNNDNQKNDGQQSPPKITPKAAEQMIQAMQQKENQTQDKVNREKAKALRANQREKNW